MIVGGVLLLTLMLSAAGEERVLVRSDHAEIVIGKERYRLVSEQAPLRAVIVNATGRKRVVINVVRLGRTDEKRRGKMPLTVLVGRKRHVFPNRPSLVGTRLIQQFKQDLIASFPVRYPLKVKRSRQVSVRVSLRRPKRGALVGVLLTLEDPKDSLLTPLTVRGEVAENAFSESSAGQKSVGKKSSGPGQKDRSKVRRRRRRQKADRPPPKVQVASVRKPEPIASSLDAGQPKRAVTQLDAGSDLVQETSQAERLDAGVLPVADAGTAPATIAQVDPPARAPRSTRGRLRVVVVDNMGGSFSLEGAELTIDGRPVQGSLPGAAGKQTLFDGALKPGAHILQINLNYTVEGGWIFSYLDGYTFHLSESARVELVAGEQTRVEVVGKQVGGFFTELEDRPSMSIHVLKRTTFDE